MVEVIKNLIKLAALFTGKAGSVLVGVLFLPLYKDYLGDTQFGVVAVILSLQALLMMLDLGTSTLVGRDLSLATRSNVLEAYNTWRSAKNLLLMFYSLILLISLSIYSFFTPSLINEIHIFGILLMFWSLTAQNVIQTGLLSMGHYVLGASLQFGCVVTRAIVTLLVFEFISSDLLLFIYAQASVSLFFQFASQFFGQIAFGKLGLNAKVKTFDLESSIKLAKRGIPLLVSGAAGAAVMQLDKPIIANFSSSAEVVPYYLAGAFCMTPLAVLARPVLQYFQPIVTSKVASKDLVMDKSYIAAFALTLSVIVLTPTSLIWFFRDDIISMWLGEADKNEVVDLVGLLLPGVALGAMGYIPYTLLVAKEDFKFQGLVSGLLTVITLLLVIQFSIRSNIRAICLVYVSYHIFSSLILWVRVISFSELRLFAFASSSFFIPLVLVLIGFFVKFNS